MNLDLTAVGNNDLFSGLATVSAHRLDLLDNVHALDDSAEYDVLAVQPLAWHSGQKELRTIGSWTSVGHRQETWLGVLEGKVFIGKLLAVDAAAACAVAVGEVTTLAHEAWDDTVERAALVTETFLACAQGSKVFY